MDDGSKSNKRRVEAQGERSSKRRNVNMELGTLDCPMCINPLSPPIFQCSMGHFLCSSCHDMLLQKKCYKCDDITPFKRCFGMEYVVQSVRVPCPNLKYGCTNQLVYHEKKKHEVMCPEGPCFCPESGCSFTGSARSLMYHLTKQHRCPLTQVEDYSRESIFLDLKAGLHVLHRGQDGFFFLFNLAREPLGLALSVFCIRPQTTKPKFICDIFHSSSQTGDSQSCSCQVRSSSLSHGVPTGYDLILPNGKVSEQGNTLFIAANIEVNPKPVAANIEVKPEPVSHSDSDSY